MQIRSIFLLLIVERSFQTDKICKYCLPANKFIIQFIRFTRQSMSHRILQKHLLIFIFLDTKSLLKDQTIINMQDQLCVQIDIAQEEPPVNQQAKIRNRRYKKMLELRKDGFFSEESIKLRHPLLFHTYLGNYSQRNRSTGPASTTISQFLHKNLLNLEYRARLQQELNEVMKEQNTQEKTERLQEGEITFGQMQGEFQGHEQLQDNRKKWEVVEEEEIDLQEDNLIHHAQELFLDGKVDRTYVNYDQIDKNQNYDDPEIAQLQFEQKYLIGEKQQLDEQINRLYYTGIQDY